MQNLNKDCHSLLFDKKYEEAFLCFLENSKTGDSSANYMIGEMYLNGSGTEKNSFKAVEYYLNSNEPLAAYRLGQIYHEGWGGEINFEAAFEWFNKSVAQGVVESNYYIGRMLSQGHGTDKNISRAVEALEKIAKSGIESKSMDDSRHKDYLSHSQEFLGYLYGQAENFPELNEEQRQIKSDNWYFDAAINGNEWSKAITVGSGRFIPIAGGDSCANRNVHFQNLEILNFSEAIIKKYEGKEIEVFDVAIKSAKDLLAKDINKSEEGDPESTYWMAERYENGLMVEKDLQKSFKYIKSAADKGYTCAQAKLGMYLLRGIGTKIDIGQSIKYLTLAQVKDDSFSYGLASAYDAEGTYQDLNRAYDLFIAAKTHWKIGLYNELGLIGSPNLLRAKEEYEIASSQGVAAAKIRLAIWEFLGIETVEDIENASRELHPYWDAGEIKELIMIGHYEKGFFDFTQGLTEDKSKETAHACLNCAWQCLKAYLQFGQPNLYGSEIRSRILVRGINWFIKAFNHDGYSEIDKFYKKQFIDLIAMHAEDIIKCHSHNLLSTKTLYTFARELRLADLESVAFPMYEKLASLGVGAAQYLVGIAYAQGDLKPQNFIKAYAWLNLACSKGIQLAFLSKEKVSNQLPQGEIIQGQKLSEEIQMHIDSYRLSANSYNDFKNIEISDLNDFGILHSANPTSSGTKIEEAIKNTNAFVIKPFKFPTFDSQRTPHNLSTKSNNDQVNVKPSSDYQPTSVKKPDTTSVFGVIVKVLLFLPFAAMFAWIVYAIGVLCLIWIFVKFVT